MACRDSAGLLRQVRGTPQPLPPAIAACADRAVQLALAAMKDERAALAAVPGSGGGEGGGGAGGERGGVEGEGEGGEGIEDERPAWTLDGWLASLDIAGAVVRQLRARLRGVSGDARLERAFMTALGECCS